MNLRRFASPVASPVRAAHCAVLATLVTLTLSCRDSLAPMGTREGAPVDAWGAQNSSLSTRDAERHVVVFDGVRPPAGFHERVSALGGTVERIFEGPGLAVVSRLSDAAALDLGSAKGIHFVERDVTISQEPPEDVPIVGLVRAEADVISILSHGAPTTATFYSRQWNLRAIAADAAWAAGHFGSPDVTVAILDSGIDYLHPDLEGRVDLSRSISLVPAEDARVASLFPGRHPITDLHSHGTATSGLIVSNGHLLAGLTQRTTLFGVKVHDGIQGFISDFLEGIIYAADHGADVIQMSFIGQFSKRGSPGLVAAVNRAVTYAHRKGAVLVAPAGNTPAPQNTLGGPGDLDHDVDRFGFCMAVHVICASATGPTSAAGLEGPWENVDAVAPYSNFGRSAIDVAAPGGGPVRVQAAIGVPVLCSQTALLEDPPIFLRCIPGENLIVSSAGTSWSAATTSGLAALLVSTMGKGRPDQIEAVIERSADDLGDPGTDPHYGRGRINVGRAVGVLP